MRPIPEDGEAMVEEYNEELKRLEEDQRNTWYTAPWLFAECVSLSSVGRSFSARTNSDVTCMLASIPWFLNLVLICTQVPFIALILRLNHALARV